VLVSAPPVCLCGVDWDAVTFIYFVVVITENIGQAGKCKKNHGIFYSSVLRSSVLFKIQLNPVVF
jgi:hypothetical protein